MFLCARNFSYIILFLFINFNPGHLKDIDLEKVKLAIKRLESNYENNSTCETTNYIYNLFKISDSDVKYLLFTRNNPKKACDLQPTQKSLQECQFDPDLETKVLTHGWMDILPPEDWKFKIKDKLLKANNYNVVVHNWTSYAQDQKGITGYPRAAVATAYIGLLLSSWIRFLQIHAGANPEKFHLLGHSLGGSVVSYAGKSICHVGRISFHDAASPGFSELPPFLRPNSNDAIYVDAIHTSASLTGMTGDGYAYSIGDVDYYPDGGNHQTKCYHGAKYETSTGKIKTVDSHANEVSCNHYSVYDYILKSFRKNCHFLGLVCASYEDFQSGKCNSDNSLKCEMGIYSTDVYDLPKHSNCYMKTKSESPYCMN